MKSDIEKSIKHVRKILRKTTYDEKKTELREELKRLKADLAQEKIS